MKFTMLFSQNINETTNWLRYMRDFIDIIESQYDTPVWFTSGTPIEILDPKWDAAEFLEGDEFEYEWRLCYVPAGLITRNNFFPKPTATETSEERLDSIEQWFAANGGAENALLSSPILLTWNSGNFHCLDGEHRIFMAHKAKLQDIPCLVGISLS